MYAWLKLLIDWPTRASLSLNSENQEVVHAIILYEIILAYKLEPGPGGLCYDCVGRNAVIVALAIAIYDAEQRARPQGIAQMDQQSDRLRDFMVRLQDQHSIHAPGRKRRIIFLAQNSADIGQVLSLSSLVD